MPTDLTLGAQLDRATYVRLLEAATEAGAPDVAWLYLEAAHVVGQLHFKAHLQTHIHMLRLAWRCRDWAETAGQLFRLALVPLGHLSGRLPLGNPGRSTVSAFQPLAVRPELVELIAQAQQRQNACR